MTDRIISDFIEGAYECLAVADQISGEGHEELARILRVSLAKMANGYHERLVRMSNRIDSEQVVLGHAREHMRRVIFPGDLRAEGKGPDESIGL